jgi:hypothetical protein
MMRGNPEVEWLLDTNRFPFTSLPAMLHDQVLRHRRNIVVSGTHGKTTTTAIAAHLPAAPENGRDPGLPDRRRAPGSADGQPPRFARRPVRHRGRRVRQRLLRQEEQVHPLRAPRRGLQQPRVRPRRHLPGPCRRPAHVHPFFAHHPAERLRGHERRRQQPAGPRGDALDPRAPGRDGRGQRRPDRRLCGDPVGLEFRPVLARAPPGAG